LIGGEIIIRPAISSDAEQLADLIALLGHQITTAGVRQRIVSLKSPQLVAAEGDRVVGLCGLHQMTAIHRERPVGRITILVVAEDAREKGIGRTLVHAAEEQTRASGCALLEVTSNERLTDAHSFYLHMGFKRTSKRFAKRLD
jgi:N-acetylglutamate synthase-like GNAT family acetyltransferase